MSPKRENVIIIHIRFQEILFVQFQLFILAATLVIAFPVHLILRDVKMTLFYICSNIKFLLQFGFIISEVSEISSNSRKHSENIK